MERQERLAALTASYDAYAADREQAGEPDWRDDIREDFAGRLTPGARVLEVAAGVGYTARWFADAGFDIIATDLSPQNVALCRAKGLTAEVRDMADLGFGDGTFSGIWAASCLMHIPDAELADTLAELFRVLLSDGLLWAGTWGGPDSEGIWDDDFYEPKRFYSIRTDERMETIYSEVFEVISFDTFDPRPDLGWHYQSALLRKASG